jgi:ribose transport system substrate-binding protein
VIIPKVAHPWFEEVRRGALAQAQLLQEKLGGEISVDYVPPAEASVTLQNSLLAEVAATKPSGILIDPVDVLAGMPAMAAARESGIPVVVFDSPSPDPSFTSVGNDYAAQGRLAARRLVELIGASGEVAIMQGFPTAPNHRQRYEAQLAVLREHPGITVVDGGVDNDSIELATAQAAAVLAARPGLRGYLCCDASGPIGIAQAIREADRVGQVAAVGMDGIEPILQAVKDGVLESSVATIPDMQGSMALLMLWQAAEGMRIPQKIDTGIDVITAANVDEFLAAHRRREAAS